MKQYVTKFNWINASQWLILIGISLNKAGELSALLLFSIILTAFFHKGYSIVKIIIIFLIIATISSINIYINNYPFYKFIQQWILLICYFICYKLFFEYNKNNLHELWEKYIKIPIFISIIGIIQFIIYFFIKIDIFPNGFSNGEYIRIHSFFQEAGNLASFLAPAITYIILSKKYFYTHKKQSIILLLTYLLTFTTIAYFILILIIIYKLTTKYRFLKYIAIFFLIISIQFLVNNDSRKSYDQKNPIEAMQMKFFDTFSAFKSFTPYDFELLNASSYTTLTNIWIACKAPNRIIGTGLGTHEFSYTSLYKSNYELYGQNKSDAYSLFTRIFSEFGFIGIILFVLYLIKFYKRNNMISLSLLFFFLSVGIRGGHYTLYGIIFFFFFYMYNAKSYIK